MPEILDEELIVDDQRVLDKLKKKAAFRFFFMLATTSFLLKYGLEIGAIAAFYQIVIAAFLVIFFLCLFAALSNTLVYLFRKTKFRPSIFLIEIIGGSFYFWLILVGLLLLERILSHSGY